MKFFASSEHRELRQTVRQFLESRSSSAQVRRLGDGVTGYDPAVWAQMGEQLGLQGLAVPEEYGGAGFGFQELVVVLEEMGRALLCAPFLSTSVLAANAVLTCCDEPIRRELLPGIADGTTIATLAYCEDEGAWEPGEVATTARRVGDRWILDGHKAFVLDGHVADLILVVARRDDDGDVALFAVGGEAAGLVRTPLPTLDQTRKLARLDMAGVEARHVGSSGAAAGLDRVADRARIALAAEQLGGAQACLDMSVAYSKVRHQFGRPIGSFQAIKHKCANMLMDVESARSAVYYGAWAVAEDASEVPALASLTFDCASRAYYRAAAEAIQIHGGIGFTWELDAQLHFKRAKSSQLFFGSPWRHQERLLEHLGV